MNVFNALAPLIAILISGPATSEIWKAIELKDECVAFESTFNGHQSRETLSYGATCVGYIAGFVDSEILHTMFAKDLENRDARLFCISGTTSYRQLAAIYVNYVNAHPKDWNEPASIILVSALRDSFPCRSK
ncbi:Rap1a/Tai family immunity protein [Burkholderia pseudomallei]|uniref:Rap1a/Tai family immunity protein n=1 Tax=Burkholderia pseudomallei TaxID=28450 RepID=UPI00351C8BF9